MSPRQAKKRGTTKHKVTKRTATKTTNQPDQDIHTGLVVDASIVNLLPEHLQQFLKEIHFTQAIVAILHCSYDSDAITSKDIKSKYNYLCREENRENIIVRGYWKKGPALILNITHKSKTYELILNGCNESPMVIKRHIREGKYGDSILFETKIHIPCTPYIYRQKSGINISK